MVSSIRELNLETTEQILHAVISQAGRGKKICKFVYPQPIIPKGKKKKKDETNLEGKRGH